MKIDDNISRFFKSIFAPYAEVDGIKFYRKSSFEDYMNQKEAEKAKRDGKFHTLRYSGYGTFVTPLFDMLNDFLDQNGGKVLKIRSYRTGCFSGRLIVDYECNKRFYKNCSFG